MLRAIQAMCVALACWACSSVATAAPLLSVSGPASVPVGGGFTLSVEASDMTDLYGYQFDLRFDPTLFQVWDVSEGPFLGTAGASFFGPGDIDHSAGLVRFVFGTLIGDAPGASGGGVLATLDVRSLGAGTGSFVLENLVALDTLLADIVVDSAGLRVSAVPEPATLALCLTLLTGLALARRRSA